MSSLCIKNVLPLTIAFIFANFFILFIFLQLTITLRKEDANVEKNQYHEYCYAGGLVEYVRWLNTDKV